MSSDEQAAGGEAKVSKVEGLKEASQGLYGSLPDDLAKPTPFFTDESVQILKHHGAYQQDNRDTRTERKKAGLDWDYKMMLRTKFPAGHLTAEQYLFCDDMATKYGQDDLRITSRQDFQFHGVLKKNLRTLIHDLNLYAKITTFGGCGDVVRNTVGCPVADIDPKFKDCGANLLDLARNISVHFLPRTQSYYDLWLDDQKATIHEDGTVTLAVKPAEGNVPDPIYGTHYLPRKFKIGVTTDFDNSIDLYTNDAGVMAVTENGRIVGYEILAGGGLGFTHNKPATYPRLASHITFVQEEEVIPVLEAIVKVQRDFGGRADRRHARLKYLIDDIGLDAFVAKVREYYGKELPAPRNVKPTAQPDYLGWHTQIQKGLNYVGVWVENGRVRDFPGAYQFKTGLRAIIERFMPDLRLTAHHNIILANIRDEDVPKVQAMLDEYGIPTDKGISRLRRLEMACPALPLCGLAMSEAERALPGVIKGIEEAGHGDVDVIVRMSGCPNNCSRPRSAELGIIGHGKDRFHVYVGGDYMGTRLCELFAENVSSAGLAPLISTLFEHWKNERKEGERFVDWSARIGAATLKERLQAAEAT